MKTQFTTIRISRQFLTKLRKMKKGQENYEMLITRLMKKKVTRQARVTQ